MDPFSLSILFCVCVCFLLVTLGASATVSSPVWVVGAGGHGLQDLAVANKARILGWIVPVGAWLRRFSHFWTLYEYLNSQVKQRQNDDTIFSIVNTIAVTTMTTKLSKNVSPTSDTECCL